MTLSSTTNRVSYSGNGTTTDFAFGYYFDNQADLVVIEKDNTTKAETVKTLTTHYTVTGAGLSSGGTVSMLVAPASGKTLIIYRATRYLQDLDLDDNGVVPAASLETRLDKITTMLQRVDEMANRSVHLPNGFDASTFDPTLPVDMVAYPATVPTLKSDGSGFDSAANWPTVTEIANAETYATNAASSATAAAGSATSAASSASSASTSASSASTSASSASTSATNAASSASSASTSATNAAASATSASGSASSASTSATNAASSATSASSSASSASTSASAASTSATNAASSASSASTSATNAAASATAAQAAASSNIWRDVVFKTFSDSPITLTQAEQGKMIAIDCSGGNVVVNLPQISGLTLTSAFVYGIKKTDSSGNSITINRGGTDTIDLATSKTISTPGAGSALIPDTDPNPDEWISADFGATAGNLTVDQFSGDGSTTAFTLSVAPGSKNNTFVAIDGVLQNKANYSVSGSTLTFVTAPPSGTNNIEVVSGTTLSIGTPAAGTVGRTQANVSSLFPVPTVQKFTSGSGTYTTPANVLFIKVRMVGGGGGGGASTTNDGSAGGDSSFNSVVAKGGSGGEYAGHTGAYIGGLGGTGGAGTATLRIAGAGGPSSAQLANSVQGAGASSALGGGAAGGGYTAAGQSAAANSGGGGTGGNNVGVIGAGGGAGEYVELIITSPASSYSYAVGAGGNGGAAGGKAGGNGGSGLIIVEEYYQ